MDKERLREFLLFIQDKTKITSLELLEKDFYLNVILSKLKLDSYVFKGGTCLSKIYLNYHRFSEDLDFTFEKQEIFDGKSLGEIKRLCKLKIDEFGKALENIGFDFAFEKSKRKYIEIGGSNRMVTFKLWYDSIAGTNTFIKVQINFLDPIKFKIHTKELQPLFNFQFSDEEQIYFKEFLDFYTKKKILVYDIKEIATEKLRALLTRRAIKNRDIVDLYFISKEGVKIEDLLNETADKIFFAINKYEKFKENFVISKKEIENFQFSYNDAKSLIIREISEGDFTKFVQYFSDVIRKLLEKLEKHKS